MYATEIATKADIEQILKAIQQLQSSIVKNNTEQIHLRSADVRKLLNISDGTLQRLRITKTLIAKKINGTWFYKKENIDKMLEMNNESK